MDQITDLNSRGLYKIAQVVELPDFVKEAQLPDAEDVTELRAEAFADSARRRYPLDTPENAWLSCAYFEKFASRWYAPRQIAKLKGRLKEAAEFWEFDYPELQEAEAEEPKIIKYAMGGTVHSEVTFQDTDDLRLIAEDLQKQAKRYPLSMRQTVARQIIAHAEPETFNEDEYVTIEKLAGYGIASIESATNLLEGRRHLLSQEKAAALIDEALDEIKDSGKQGLLAPGMTDKVARLADSIDRLAGQHVRYTPATLPEQALYSLTLSQMDDFHKNAVHLSNGIVLTPQEVQDGRLKRFLKNYTGEKVAEDQLKEKLEGLDSRASDLAVQALKG